MEPDRRVEQAVSGSAWERLRALCTGGPHGAAAALPLDLPAIDAVLPAGGLSAGGVHEWIGDASRTRWTPPLTILCHLARQSAMAVPSTSLVWIGEAVWPHPPSLDVCGGQLLTRSLFLRASGPGERLWAIDLALRSGGVAAVIADGSRLDLSATRRLQLAAEAGGAVCFLARPPRERTELSAATTRWEVRVMPHASDQLVPARRWTVELLRCKGVQPAAAAPRRWILERPHATGDGLVASVLLDRPGAATVPPQRRSG